MGHNPAFVIGLKCVTWKYDLDYKKIEKWIMIMDNDHNGSW